MNYHKIIEDIEKLIKGDISTSVSDLKIHAKDASLFTVQPAIVIYPKDKFDIQAIVRYIYKLKSSKYENSNDREFVNKLSLTARAAGTDMTGGPLNDSIILDVTKYMKSFGKIGKGIVPTIECEPGLYFRDLEKYLDQFGLMYPSYPASKDLCCVGGIVSNNSSGEKSLSYGSTRDWVEEVEMVMDDGEIINFKKMSFWEIQNFIDIDLKKENFTLHEEKKISNVQKIYREIIKLIEDNKLEIANAKPKVSKNSSGYDLWDVISWEEETVDFCKLIVGSQGTLGIITSVKLRLTERKKFSQMLTVLMPDLNGLVSVVDELLKYKPEAIETFDDKTFKIVMKFLPTIVWRLKGSILQLAVSFLPEVVMAIKGVFTGGIPRLILLVEFTGQTQVEANQKANKALESIKGFNYKSRITKSELEMQKYWLFRHESFNLLRNKLRGYKVAPFVEDLIVPSQNMPEFIAGLQIILDKYGFVYTIQGHAGNGNFHIFPMMKQIGREEVEIIKKINQEVFSLVQKYHGSLSAEHNDGLVRTPYLHFMFSDKILDLFVQVKQFFDPLNIFNPGKKVGGSIEENYKKIEIVKTK